MKKYWLALIVVLFTYPTLINAQEYRFGIVASPGISWFNTDVSRIKGDGSKLGINIGLMVDRYFAEHYAFATGISIHSMGGILQYREGKTLQASSGDITLNPGSRVQYNLQYLHIPFGLKFKTTEIGYTTYFAQLGLNAMFNIKARASVKNQDISDESVGKEINFLYMGYHIGAGIEYRIVGNTALIGGLSYMNGFTDVTSDGSEKTLMHGIEFKIGVIF
jgi:hypothetical protein